MPQPWMRVEEALRAQRGLQQQGVPEGDLRLYDGEEILRIASRLQQERSLQAKAINEVVVDHQLRSAGWPTPGRAVPSFGSKLPPRTVPTA
jgi:hypothetical protein